MTTELPDRWLTEEEKRTLCSAIDAYGWKHSWHMPKDRNGYTNWDSSETLAKCREVLQKYRRDAVRFAALCDKLDERIESIEAAIVKFDAECDAVDAEVDRQRAGRMKNKL